MCVAVVVVIGQRFGNPSVTQKTVEAFVAKRNNAVDANKTVTVSAGWGLHHVLRAAQYLFNGVTTLHLAHSFFG